MHGKRTAKEDGKRTAKEDGKRRLFSLLMSWPFPFPQACCSRHSVAHASGIALLAVFFHLCL